MSRYTIIGEVIGERTYQENKGFDIANDDLNTEDDWHTWIKDYLEAGKSGPDSFKRRRLIQVAALAVAAVEAYDRNGGFPK